MSKKRACYNCANMMICDVYHKQQAVMNEAFRKQILSAYDLPEAKITSPSVKIYEVIGKGCLYFAPFPTDDKHPINALGNLISGKMEGIN